MGIPEFNPHVARRVPGPVLLALLVVELLERVGPVELVVAVQVAVVDVDAKTAGSNFESSIANSKQKSRINSILVKSSQY